MAETVLDSQHFDRSDRRDRGADGRSFLQDDQITLDICDVDGLANENERLWIRVDPGIAVRAVDHGRVRDDLLRGAAPGLRNLDIDALARFQRMAGGIYLVIL